MSLFHKLTIRDIRQETPDCVSIAFEIPASLEERYRFQAGQNVTLRAIVEGEELRRSYSICSSPLDQELRIAVKKIGSGRFSGHANQVLQPGDAIDVMPPSGRFSAANASGSRYLAFAAGSGITPVISIIKTVLQSDPQSSFTLVYGNRDRNSVIFREQLQALKNRFMDRFSLHLVFSREEADAAVYTGRIDAAKCEQLAKYLLQLDAINHIFLCGPEEMIFAIRDWLATKNIAPEKIHYELFTVPGQQVAAAGERITAANNRKCTVSIKIDGTTTSFQHPFEGEPILDGALRHGADLPFACKGGVCATCKARLLQGQVRMDNNYALEQEELDQGFILTCQSHPLTSEVMIDFDQK